MPKKSVQWGVVCNTHGRTHFADNNTVKDVFVGVPKSRRVRREGGCPLCKLDAAKAAKEAQ